MVARATRPRLLACSLAVSMALAGCGRGVQSSPVASVCPVSAEREAGVAAAGEIDLLAEVVEDSEAVMLVAALDEPASHASGSPAATVGRTAAPSTALDAVAEHATSPAMSAVVQQAAAHVRQGFDLANRGAHFSARAEFLHAVRVVAQGLDAQQKTGRHSLALAAGMRAVEEADDLVPRGTRLEGDIDVYTATRPHQTRVLKDIKAGELTPQAALQRYYAYAEEQFATAAGGERTAASALYAIGKLHALWASQQMPTVVAAEAKAVVFYQAALLVDPTNAIAANDLAVLLARVGRLEQARALLVRAVQQNPQPAVWHNLSVVHARLGEAELARLARENAMRTSGGVDPANAQAVVAMQSVKWVDPKTFASSARPATDLPAPAARATATPAEPAAAQNQPAAKTTRWFHWGTSQR